MLHCVKNVQIRSFFWYGVSLRIQSECGKIRSRKNLFGHFPPRVTYYRTFGINVEFYGQCRGVIRYLLNSINGTFCENSSQYFVSNFFPESFHHPDF